MTNSVHSDNLTWEADVVNGQYDFGGQTHEMDEKIIVNSENGKKISIMGKKYPVLKNSQFVELAEMAAEAFALEINHYTTRKGGKQVLVAFARPEKSFFIGKWEVQNHLIFINSHDGTRGFEVGCNNGLYRCNNMFASTKIQTKIYHNSGMQDAIDELKMRIMGVDEILEQELETLNRWQHVQIAPAIIQNAKEELFNLGGQTVSTAMANKLSRFDASVAKEFGELGHNLFALFNSATDFTTHRFNSKGSLEFGKDFPIFGTRAKLNAKAFEICTQLETELTA